MKKAYIITGIGCSGKTSIAEKISRESKNQYYPIMHTDDVFLNAIDKLGVTEENRTKINDIQTWTDPAHIGKENYQPYESFEQCIRDCYAEEFAKKEDIVVIEGESPILRPKEWEIMMENLQGYAIRIFFLNPDYNQWIKNRSGRYYEQQKDPHQFLPPFSSPDEYAEKQRKFRELLPKNYFEINDYSQLDIRMTVPEYQYAEFSEPKWGKFQFPFDMKGKTFLDIGCNAGWFLYKATMHGAKAYGVDMDWHLLDIAMDRAPEAEVTLKKIEEFESGMQFDYVLCSSSFHFFTDHEKVLAKIAEITKEYFILEVPVLEDDKYDMIHGEDMRSAVPTRKLLMQWLSNNFKNIEEIATTDQWQPNEQTRKVRHVFRCSN